MKRYLLVVAAAVAATLTVAGAAGAANPPQGVKTAVGVRLGVTAAKHIGGTPQRGYHRPPPVKTHVHLLQVKLIPNVPGVRVSVPGHSKRVGRSGSVLLPVAGFGDALLPKIKVADD